MSSTATVKKTTRATEGVRTRSTSRASRKENSQDRTIRTDPGQTVGVGPQGTGVSGEEITNQASNEIPLGRTRRGTQELKERIEAAKSKITSQSQSLGGATGSNNLTTGNAATSVLSRIGLDYRLGPTNDEEQEYDPILPENLTGPQETEGESSRGRSKTRETPFDDLWQEDDEELTQQYLTAHEDLDNNPVRFGDGLSFDETRGSQISEQEELEQIQQRNQELKQQQEEHFQRLQQAKRELEEEKC